MTVEGAHPRDPDWLEALLREVTASVPKRALLLAPRGHPLATALRARLAALDEAAAPATRYDLALVAGVIEPLPLADARALLADLRDRAAAHTVLWLDASRSALREDGVRALGFRVLARDGAQLLCGFDLADYKDRPDWLNAKHWAHPERWDRFRW